MKTAKYMVAAAMLALLGATGCNDNLFLEEHPKSEYTIDNAFESSDQIENMLSICYLTLWDWYAKAPGNPWTTTFQFKSFGTDVLDQPYWRNNGTGGYSNFSTWTTLSDQVKFPWNECYKVIAYANLTLEGCGMESIAWTDEAHRTRVAAEARFMRGFCYLRLAELYGGVPVVTEFTEETRNDYVRETREYTYDFAVGELLAAYDDLPDYPSADGRVGKGAAAHMLAEAFLALGVETGDATNYTEAEKYAKAAIELHPMMTDRFGRRADPSDGGSYHGVANYFADGNVMSDLFVPGNFDRSAGNTEAIWVMQTPTYEQQDTYGGKLGAEPMFFSMVARDVNWSAEYAESGAAAGPWKGSNLSESSTSAHVGGFGINEASPTEYAAYGVWTDPDDLRHMENATVRTKFLCFDRDHSMFNQYVSREMLDQNPTNISKFFPIFSKIIPLDDWSYRDTDTGRQNWSHDAYAIRSAETWLLLAEAYLRQGRTAEAADAVNEVRSRAGCSIMYSAAEMDIDVILDERIRECLFEEGRWFTFLRMEPEVWKQRIYDHAYYWADYKQYSTPIKWDLWPIPQDVIDLNTGAKMLQNEGWN